MHFLSPDLFTQGAFIVSQVFARALLEEEQDTAGEGKGAIVNIISLFTKQATPGTGVYATSKAAALALTKNSALAQLRLLGDIGAQ